MHPCITTILHRPYVFAFLVAYLVLAWRRWGWPRTLLWLVSGYAIAWLSEVSSIHNGFPYGEYHYVYENLHGELLIAGVPFFDSLSYAFLTFAGFVMGEHLLVRWGDSAIVRWKTQKRSSIALSDHRPIAQVFLGALLTMALDVIIDPIATMGDKWFLGKIHWYAHPGWYFGVPLTNFAGWFLVSFAIIGGNVLAWHAIARCETRDTRHETRDQKHFPNILPRNSSLAFPAFYAGIALFNIAISFWVGEWTLGVASSAIISIIAASTTLSRRSTAKGQEPRT